MPECRGILGRLPRYYRREGGDIFERYVRILEDEIEDVLSRLEGSETRLAKILADWRSLPAGSELASEGIDPRSAGTAKALEKWFRRRGSVPRVWPGWTVRPASRGMVQFARSHGRSALLVWTRNQASEPPEKIEVPDSLLPAGCGVDAVWLAEEPRPSPPPSGAAVEGRRLVLRRIRGSGPSRHMRTKGDSEKKSERD